MKISGFTFAKNSTKLYFPVKESILSILPMVDEFVIALGNCDPDDTTRAEIESIKSGKIKIVDTVWNPELFPMNTLYAQQTDLAKSQCSGDWLFYLQSDEVVHEKDIDKIYSSCQEHFENSEVEGLIFNYLHFWGDYAHYFKAHSWYSREIRIIRNLPEIHSWRDAQSFRIYDSFNENYNEYLRKEGTRKLKVAEIKADIYHYGWVRPPKLMRSKAKKANPEWARKMKLDDDQSIESNFDYGPLNKLPEFKGSHPKVMRKWTDLFSWKDQLQYSGNRNPARPPYKHEQLKYRILSGIENLIGVKIGGFKNYNIIR